MKPLLQRDRATNAVPARSRSRAPRRVGARESRRTRDRGPPRPRCPRDDRRVRPRRERKRCEARLLGRSSPGSPGSLEPPSSRARGRDRRRCDPAHATGASSRSVAGSPRVGRWSRDESDTRRSRRSQHGPRRRPQAPPRRRSETRGSHPHRARTSPRRAIQAARGPAQSEGDWPSDASTSAPARPDLLRRCARGP